MIISIGTDLVETKRLKQLYQSHGRDKLLKVFRSAELDYALSAKHFEQRLALRFAVKEACFKAFSVAGLGDFPYHNFEYLNNQVTLHGKARASAEGLVIHVSTAHTDAHATAFVVLEKGSSVITI